MTAREQPLNQLNAVRQVGDEAFQNVYKLAQKREAPAPEGRKPSPMENSLGITNGALSMPNMKTKLITILMTASLIILAGCESTTVVGHTYPAVPIGSVQVLYQELFE